MKRIVLFLTALLLMVLLLYWVDFNSFLLALSSIDLSTLIFLCSLQIITILLLNLQWYTIIKKLHGKVKFHSIIHITMTGTFVESITPAVKAGGEAARVMLFRSKLKFETGESIAIVTLQKTVSLFAFMFVNAISLIIYISANNTLDNNSTGMLLSGFFILALFTLFLISIVIFPGKLLNHITRLPGGSKLSGRINNTIESFKSALKGTTVKTVVLQFVLSLIIWCFFPVKAWLGAMALDLDISFINIAIITFLTYMIAMIPALPGGMGTFEGGMILMLSSFGIQAHQGAAMAILLRFVTFWFVFLISAVYLFIYNVSRPGNILFKVPDLFRRYLFKDM